MNEGKDEGMMESSACEMSGNIDGEWLVEWEGVCDAVGWKFDIQREGLEGQVGECKYHEAL